MTMKLSMDGRQAKVTFTGTTEDISEILDLFVNRHDGEEDGDEGEDWARANGEGWVN